MADLGIQEIRGAAAETVSGAALPFRFEVSWRSLSNSAESRPAPVAKASGGGSTALDVPPSEVLKERKPAPPPAKSRAKVGPTQVEPSRVEPSRIEPPRVEPSSIEPERHVVAAPAFGMAAGSAPSSKGRLLVVFGLLAALAIGVSLTIGRGSATRDAGPAMTTEMGEAGWLAEWASDRRGSVLGRQISLYRPSVGTSDYRLEFTGRIERNSLGWVFRAADTKNYWVGKVSESAGRLALTRFAVIKGVEGARNRITLPLLAGVRVLKVRLDARGSRFTIYLQNEVVDDWQDDRLTTGAVGFLNERDERGQVDSVQISFLKGGIAQ